jgi:hypothetical protein
MTGIEFHLGQLLRAEPRRPPKSQAILVRHVLEWFGEPEPSDSQVKHHIGPLYVALRDVSEKNSSGSPRK